MFGKGQERLRQWSLLGALLKRARLLDALEFMGLAFGAKAVDWYHIREEAAKGGSLLEIADEATPAEVLAALEAGEDDGRLPERLADLLPQSESSPLIPVGDEGVVPVVSHALMDAVEQGASGMLLRKTPAGNAEWKILLGDFWTPRATHTPEEFSAIGRRFWILAGQHYWAPKPGVFKLRMPQGMVEMRVTPDPKGGLGIEILSTTKD
jgi:hypothetical protein